ncbi:MAG: hypothetical protein DI556_21995, partial [Rhodovulum sulfidophilum]
MRRPLAEQPQRLEGGADGHFDLGCERDRHGCERDRHDHHRPSREAERARRGAYEGLARRDRSGGGGPRTRVTVLTGALSRAFRAGTDIGGIPRAAGVADADSYDLERSAQGGLYIRLMDLSGILRRKPMIGAVQGYCLGGGFEIASQCDMLVAAENAGFGLPEGATGRLPGVGGVGAVPRALPRNVATHLAFTAERLPAARAHELGLVSAV